MPYDILHHNSIIQKITYFVAQMSWVEQALVLHRSILSTHFLFCIHSEFPSASARPQPAWHHHQVCWHGEEGDQQTSQAEREEE